MGVRMRMVTIVGMGMGMVIPVVVVVIMIVRVTMTMRMMIVFADGMRLAGGQIGHGGAGAVGTAAGGTHYEISAAFS
jgi:hypothetical protein